MSKEERVNRSRNAALVDWDSLPAPVQWLHLIRHELKREVTTCLANGEGDEALAMLERFLEIRSEGTRFDARVSPTPLHLDSSHFLTTRFREILSRVRLVNWPKFLSLLESEHIPLTDTEVSGLELLSEIWRDLTSENRRTRLSTIDALIDFLSEKLGWSHVSSSTIEGVQIRSVSISQSSLAIPKIIPILVTFIDDFEDGPDQASGYIMHIQHALKRVHTTDKGPVLINVAIGEAREPASCIEKPLAPA